MAKSQILALHQKLVNQEITLEQIKSLVGQKQNELKGSNTIINRALETNNLTELNKQLATNKNNLLFGIPYSLKDNIATDDVITTGGSLFLKNFTPPYNATVYELLKTKNAILTSKVNLDEFGLGGTGTFSAYGIVKNIHNHEHITGGSSSGSVNAVAYGESIFSLGTDTGDSVRRPSSLTGVVGYKPSYGLLSRYGVYPYAPSLDHVGIIAQYVTDIAIVAQNITQFDEKDLTSQKIENSQFYDNLKTLDNITFGVIEGLEQYLDESVKALYLKAIEQIKAHGFKVVAKAIDWRNAIVIDPLYKAISYAEASSCYANMTGITFGTNFNPEIKGYENIIINNRSKGFGRQLKRRFIIGEYITKGSNYFNIYFQSRKCRAYLARKFNQLMENVDCLILPGASSTAHNINDTVNKTAQTTLADDLLQLANFAASPSITIPYQKAKNNLPFGLNLNCRINHDQKLLNIALSLEEIFDYKQGETPWLKI
ncbi:MAG: Asp-tRNA(Asn)/Glu-tRNA(Gln) amidotransferase GatCAB subunit A [Mycoplasma sp.]